MDGWTDGLWVVSSVDQQVRSSIICHCPVVLVCVVTLYDMLLVATTTSSSRSLVFFENYYKINNKGRLYPPGLY